MFEAGKKYMFSRSAYYNDMVKKSPNFTLEAIWWANELDGHVFVGLGSNTQTINKGVYRFKILPEWCASGEEDELI